MSKEQIRQTAHNFLEGPNKGNLTACMKEAGYSKVYAEHKCDRMGSNIEFKQALEHRKAEIDEFEGIKIEVVAQRHEELYKACIKAKDRSNAARVLESEAKHVGFYGKDHEQANEARQLSDKRETEAKRLAKLLNENPQLSLHKPAG